MVESKIFIVVHCVDSKIVICDEVNSYSEVNVASDWG